MRIGFLDFSGWDYTPAAPYERPLGGSQSAICYLTEELVKLGHEVLLVNGGAAKAVVRGVICMPQSSLNVKLLQTCDVVVVQNTTQFASKLRANLKPHAALILWTQHAHDQPAIHGLLTPEIRDAYDGFAFVSAWQRDCYLGQFALAPQRCAVMRNAASPAVLAEPLLVEKPMPPVLAYSSTPFRGLNVLLEAFPEIRAKVPDVRLKVFSSMQVYQVAPSADEARNGDLYRRCRATEGVEYVGSLGQAELAMHLRSVTMLAYPNHFAETSCIAAIEALASGASVVTSDLGALPETCSGFARLIPWTNDRDAYRRGFVSQVVEELEHYRCDSAGMAVKAQARAEFFRSRYTWQLRAGQWAQWLEGVMSARTAGKREIVPEPHYARHPSLSPNGLAKHDGRPA